ncbi:HEAT repeat domain-containing protein [Aquisphaera insulae]|uniref:HEAT repeat domain-containing protein n=1 Tax=Aquisphaera insulae TaxID=2712864 RepID=UPI0013EB1C21|nr:HEAT repeat domain-containing protein [Aquisphaera insulae]
MRLTLRTLLAWLDDTLPPSQVREIGKQVSSSPFARELVDRIHRVTRQRRYTVPGKSGPEATDPNVVAGYVDNDLEPDQVAEYEKKCLTSDVNLAEVAAVHQILSLLGQKVHVPADVKSRMYFLVKGRESIVPPRANGVAERPSEPVTRPIQPWVAPEPPKRHWVERFGPAAACVGLIGLLSWSAYLSLGPSSDQGVASPPAPVAIEGPAAPKPAAVPAKAPPVEETVEAEAPAPDTRKPDVPAEKSGPAEPTKTASPASTPTAVPPGAIGVVEKSDGLLLRFDADKQSWEKLAAGASLNGGDRVLCLAPFRSRLVIGKSPVTLLGETEIRLTGKAVADPVSLDLAEGKVVVEPGEGATPLRVEFAGHTATIARPSRGVVGLERRSAWAFGHRPEAAAALAIFSSEGDASATIGASTQGLSGPGQLVADASGTIHAVADKAMPEWLTASDPSLKDQKLAEQFNARFAADRPALSDIVVLTEDESPVVRKFAIQGLKAMGDLSLLMPILGKNDPGARQGAVAALRSYIGLGPEALRHLRQALDEEFGPEVGQVAESLLVGRTPPDSPQPEALKRLVDLLSPRDQPLVIRSLALDNLMTITGRGDQGYDPDKADEKGYNAWKTLSARGELKPAAAKKGD